MLLYKTPISSVMYMGGVMAIPEEFVSSLANMIAYNYEYVLQPDQIIWYDRATASYHATARNDLVQRFIGDYLLMLDTDHKFEPDLFARLYALMKKHDLDVLSGLYRYRAYPHTPTVYSWVEQSKAYAPRTSWPMDQDIVEIDCAGAGCLMAHRRVFKKIKAELREDPFAIEGVFSEDFSFFNRLRRLGIKAHLAPKIESWHLGVVPISEDLTPQHLRPGFVSA